MCVEDTLVLKNIYDQFKREIAAIRDYVDFMEKSVVLNGLKDEKHSIYNLDDVEGIQNKIEILNKENAEEISATQSKIEKDELYDIPEWFKSIDARSEEGELIDFIFEFIDEGISDREKILSEMYSQLQAMCISDGCKTGGEFYLKLYDNKEKIYEYIDYSLKAYHNNLVFDHEEELETLKNYQRLLRLIDTKNNINIYRQAFIQLIALFDALVFECFRIQFSKNFFKWLKLFDNENIKLHEIADNDNFDDFKNMIIEKKLKSLYLKDLLDILNRIDPSLFHIGGEMKYANFREIINRRNCHIHSNGIVDKAYLGISKNSTNEIFNIYNFNIGDYAEINKQYLNMSLNYCSEFIKSLTQT